MAHVTKELLIAKRQEMEGELAKGQALLQRQQLEMDRTRLTVTRIQGAVVLLDELLAQVAEATPDEAIPDNVVPLHSD